MIKLSENYKLTTSSGKPLKKVSHAHIVSLMNKLLTSSNNSDIINDEIVAKVDKLLEYKGISKKQHKQILFKRDLL